MAPNQPNMTVTPLSEQQIAEQHDRQNEIDAGNGEAGDEVVLDQQQGDGAGGEGDGRPAPREKPIAMSPGDLKRQQMIDRFKRPGTGEFDGDLNKPENIYGEVGAEHVDDEGDGTEDPDADAAAVAEAARAAAQPEVRAPRMITQTIRGKQITLSEDEWLERARKVEAADSYLEESRVLLETAKDIRAERADPNRRPNGDETRTRDDEQGSDPSDQHRPNGDLDLASVVEKIQFGDPKEAAAELGKVISTVVAQQQDAGHISRLVEGDLANSKAELLSFRKANPALDADQKASKVVEENIYDIYREDIIKLGMDEAQIPKNPKDLADWHRFYRVNGHPVKKTSEVLNEAKDRFLAWRGGSPQPEVTPKPAPTERGAPRVAVNVDRTERRQAIPLQPNRAVAPRRNEAPAKTEQQSRKDAVNEMRKQRGQVVIT